MTYTCFIPQVILAALTQAAIGNASVRTQHEVKFFFKRLCIPLCFPEKVAALSNLIPTSLLICMLFDKGRIDGLGIGGFQGNYL